MAYPAMTDQGEQVMVVEKRVEDGANAINTTVLVAEDGRLFAPTPNGLRITEIADTSAASSEAPAAPTADDEE